MPSPESPRCVYVTGRTANPAALPEERRGPIRPGGAEADVLCGARARYRVHYSDRFGPKTVDACDRDLGSTIDGTKSDFVTVQRLTPAMAAADRLIERETRR